jgi:hypothetical protein
MHSEFFLRAFNQRKLLYSSVLSEADFDECDSLMRSGNAKTVSILSYK